MGNKEYLQIIEQQSSIYDKERVQHYFLKTSRIFKGIIFPGSSVLEIGSGTGYYVIDFAKHGRDAVGIDYSGSMVEIAKRNAKKAGVSCEFLYADAEKDIPLKRRFDFVFLLGNWEYFNDPIAVLRNSEKVLAPHGRIIISTLNVLSWPLITFLEKTGIKKLSPAFWHFHSLPSRVRRYARIAGFTVERSFFNYYLLDKVYILKRSNNRP